MSYCWKQQHAQALYLADCCSTQVLRSRETNIQQSLAALEKERGVSGFRDTTENLERVAEQKVMSENNLLFYSAKVEKFDNYFFYRSKGNKA